MVLSILHRGASFLCLAVVGLALAALVLGDRGPSSKWLPLGLIIFLPAAVLNEAMRWLLRRETWPADFAYVGTFLLTVWWFWFMD